MEPQDITNTLTFFQYNGDAIRARAECEELILTFHILRGGTYNATFDWFREQCAQSPYDWRTTGRLLLEEIQRGCLTHSAHEIRIDHPTYIRLQPLHISQRRAKRRARKARRR